MVPERSTSSSSTSSSSQSSGGPLKRKIEHLFVVGGIRDATSTLDIVESYDAASTQWFRFLFFFCGFISFLSFSSFLLVAQLLVLPFFLLTGKFALRCMPSAGLVPLLSSMEKSVLLVVVSSARAASTLQRFFCSSALFSSQTALYPSFLSYPQLYDPVTNEWTKLPNMTQKRSACAAESMNGNVYVFGGFDGLSSTSGSVPYPILSLLFVLAVFLRYHPIGQCRMLRIEEQFLEESLPHVLQTSRVGLLSCFFTSLFL
jgi:hypothetical protein